MFTGARKLVEGFAEFLVCHNIESMQFAKLEPMADILLKYVIKPDEYPLIFPQDASDLLMESELLNEEEDR